MRCEWLNDRDHLKSFLDRAIAAQWRKFSNSLFRAQRILNKLYVAWCLLDSTGKRTNDTWRHVVNFSLHARIMRSRKRNFSYCFHVALALAPSHLDSRVCTGSFRTCFHTTLSKDILYENLFISACARLDFSYI